MTDRLDDAIDRAVRDMLDVEPPADLRARVMAKLPASGSQLPASGFRLPASGWVLVPAAAAAIILLALFVAHRSEPVAPKAPVVAVDRHFAPEAPARVNPVVDVPAPRVAPTVERRVASSVAAPGTVLATNVAGKTDIDPLKAIASIAMPEIAQESIAPADIAIRPLNTITEVQIAPLTPPDRR